MDLHADPAARDRALVLELADHGLDGVGGDREGDADRAARRREDRGVDADHVAVGVEGRAAGIALVDRRIDLDEVVIGAGADVAAARRDDAGRHGAAEAERIADREHPVADARGLSDELHIGERAALDLDQREIGARIGADHLGLVGLAVVGGDLRRSRPCRPRDCWSPHSHRPEMKKPEPWPVMMLWPWPCGMPSRTVRDVRHAEAAEEFAQARRKFQLPPRAGGLRSAVHLDADRDHRRLHLLDDVGKADRRRQLVRLLGQVLRERGRIAARQIEAGPDHERSRAEAGNGGGEQDDAAGGQHAPFLGIRSGGNARVHRQKLHLQFGWARWRAVSNLKMG